MEKRKGVGLICEAFNQFASLEEKNWKIGYNTGNILFFNAIYQILDCNIVSGWDKETLKTQDAIVTTEMIWIREGDKPTENTNYWLKNLQVPLIPISVGLQSDESSPDFKLAPEMQYMLSAIQERATICVRGEYTAAVLERHGVKNFEIIGCPSVYQLPIFQDGVDFLFDPRRSALTTANYKTFLPPFQEIDKKLLAYIAVNSDDFAEQTLFNMNQTELKKEPFAEWYSRYACLFFDVESWVRYNQRFGFSFGLRFHGNLAAVLGGARAFFITLDSRTREMTQHFGFPSLALSEFDTDKSLDHYFEMTDYTVFRQRYKSNVSKFLSVLDRNGLPIRDRYRQRLDTFNF